jgi:hypothetical protein
MYFLLNVCRGRVGDSTVPLAIVIYIDGSFVKHKIPVKPIYITVRNLNSTVSGKACAWRVLGMMPNLRKSATLAQTETWRKERRLRLHHACIEHVVQMVNKFGAEDKYLLCADGVVRRVRAYLDSLSMDGAEVAINCLCSVRSCATCWCPDDELADGHRGECKYRNMAHVAEQLDAARDKLLDEDDDLVGRVKDRKAVEKDLRHKLLPRNAWRLVPFFNLFMSCPKDELHQWYVPVYPKYVMVYTFMFTVYTSIYQYMLAMYIEPNIFWQVSRTFWRSHCSSCSVSVHPGT